MDLLAVGSLVGGLVPAVAGVADPYFYTQQEQARDGLAGQQLTNQQAALTTAAQIATERERTTQQAITYGLAGVLVVSGVFLGSRVIGRG